MKGFQALQAFYSEHGHADVAATLGEESELARWCAAQRAARRKEALSAKRIATLDGISFRW